MNKLINYPIINENNNFLRVPDNSKEPFNDDNNNSHNSSSGSTLTIKNNLIIESMSQLEFEKFLQEILVNNPGVEKLDLSDLLKNEKLHFYIYNLIRKNYPLIGVSRLIGGEKIVNLTFFNIKKLNELLGKDLVNIFINKFKEIILKNFIQIIDNEKPGRLVRDNYKHLTFSLRKDLDISKKLFNGKVSIDELIEQVLKEINNGEYIKGISLSGKKNLTIEEIKSIFRKFFSFGIGASNINGHSISEKLKSFYMGEIASRSCVEINNLGEKINFDFGKIKLCAGNVINIEKNIIKKYINEKFIYQDTKYDIVINGKINPILLRIVRKGEKISYKNNQEVLILIGEIKKYINNLNDGFDFISPVIYKNDFEDIENLNNQISSLVVDAKYIKNNYKNTLSLEYLNSITRNKNGIRLFIDIIDMGIMNLADFKKLATKVNNGEINENNFNELLKAGTSVTNKFLYLVFEIKRLYSGTKISLGGDEIFIFIPGKDTSEISEIIKKISLEIQKAGLKGRISSYGDNKGNNIYEKLDNITKINKTFESLINNAIQNSQKLKDKGENEIQIINLEIYDLNFINNNLSIIVDKTKQVFQNINFESLIDKGTSIKQILNIGIIDIHGKAINKDLNIEINKINNYISITIN